MTKVEFAKTIAETGGTVSGVALARTEKKSGSGYHGFKVNFDKSVTIEQKG